MSNTKRWEKILKIRGGHSFWRDAENSHLAISDESGSHPGLTDDGILYVDKNKPMTLIKSMDEPVDNTYSLALFDEDGECSSTILNSAEKNWLWTNHGMRVWNPDAHGADKTYTIRISVRPPATLELAHLEVDFRAYSIDLATASALGAARKLFEAVHSFDRDIKPRDVGLTIFESEYGELVKGGRRRTATLETLHEDRNKKVGG